MNRLFLTTALLVLTLMVVAPAVAQDEKAAPEGWKKSLIFDFTTTQASYSNSWKGGEDGSVNWVSNLNGFAEKQLRPKFNFRSTIKMSFGQTHTQSIDSLGEKSWNKPQKTTDLIDWENVGRFTLHQWVDPYVAFRLESVFYDGSHPEKKLYFSPLKLTQSVGAARRFYEKDNDQVTSRLGFAIREIFTKTLDSTITATDGGLEMVTDADYTIRDNIKYVGKLSLFKALFFKDKDKVKGFPEEDYWKAIDVNWENTVTAQITKIIAVNFYTQLLYDKQISRSGRFKETLGIGVTITMI